MKNKFFFFSFISVIPSLVISLAFLVLHIKIRIRGNSKRLFAELAPIIGEKTAREIAEIYRAKLDEMFFNDVRGLDLLTVFPKNFKAPQKTLNAQ